MMIYMYIEVDIDMLLVEKTHITIQVYESPYVVAFVNYGSNSDRLIGF